MSAQFYVKEMQQKVAAKWRRIAPLGQRRDVDAATDIEAFATFAGGSLIVRLPDLTQKRGLAHLSETYRLVIGDHVPTDVPLAGALCVADNARHRWILVREDDIPRRQRFTIAHELGHLFLEVEPTLENAGQGSLQIEGQAIADNTVRMFSRCASIDSEESDVTRPQRGSLSQASLLEVKADHFASELLMPYDGITRLLREFAGGRGIVSERDLGAAASAIADRYQVSAAAARRRLVKDLAVVPVDADANGDLFA